MASADVFESPDPSGDVAVNAVLHDHRPFNNIKHEGTIACVVACT